MKKLFVIAAAAALAATCAVHAAAIDGTDVTAWGKPFAFTESPAGGGNKDINILVDGIRPESDAGSDQQYDTYHGETPSYEEYFGLEYEAEVEFTGFEFTEGIHFGDGGFYVDGSLKVQVLQGDKWVDVTPTNDVGYPVGTAQGDFGPNYETYVFEFAPVKGTAIRATGMTGGNGVVSFGSCSELTAYATAEPSVRTYAERREAEAAAKAAEEAAIANQRAKEGFIEQISTPITTMDDMSDNVGGGSKTLSTINDGYIMKDGDTWDKQFDTVSNKGKWDPYHVEYIGYEFPSTYTVEYVEFYEGGNFFDGGFYAYSTIGLEALVNGEWIEVDADIDPDYPDGDTQEEFLPNFECYTFTLKTPTACDGIRVTGEAGGSAYFISCTEMIVKAQVEAPAEEPAPEEPAVEEPVVEEPVVEEPVVEEPVVEEAVEEPAPEEVTVEEPEAEETAEETISPNTFDPALLIALGTILSGCGFALSRKKH